MISVKVSYTVNSAYAEQNKQHIAAFLADFKAMKHLQFLYNVYLQEDGLTFLHISTYENKEVQRSVLATPSFVAFQQARDRSQLSASPIVEVLSLLGSSLGLVKD